MSAPHTPEDLVEQVQRLLEKHEVQNQLLAIELAILITKREKTVVKQSFKNASEVLDGAFRRLSK